MMKKSIDIIPGIVFLIISIGFCFPIFENFSYWGQMDWDQFTFWNAVPRETILKYHQFPLWNPYANGGNVLLAHPHSSFLSPMYIFVLLFGVVAGLKIEIIVHLFLGLMGMFKLSRYLKIEIISSYIAAFVFMLNSIYALHLTEGHTSWLSIGFIPWVFLFYLKSLVDIRQLWGSVFFLGLMILAGSVDAFSILAMFLVIYSFLKSIQLKSFIPLSRLILLFLGAFLFCSIKLMPMVEFLMTNSRVIIEDAGVNLSVLNKILLSKDQVFLDSSRYQSFVVRQNMGLQHGWHEFGAYVGIVPLMLCFYGVFIRFKQNWPLILTGIFLLLISLGGKAPINIWKLVHSLPVYDSLQVPSRFILGAIFSVSLLAGFGALSLERFSRNFKNSRIKFLSQILISLMAVFIFFDLFQVNSPIFKDAFRIKPLEVTRNKEFKQRYDVINLHEKVKEGDYQYDISHSSMYPVFLSNSGILAGYEVLNVKKGLSNASFFPRFFEEGYDGYRGEAYLLGSDTGVDIEYFSPNKIILNIVSENVDWVVLNQNYYKGWRVWQNNKLMKAQELSGLIAKEVSKGTSRITFFYCPNSFLIGVCISFLFFLSFVFFVKQKYFNDISQGVK